MTIQPDWDVIAGLESAAQLVWFRSHSGVIMRYKEWDRFYCSSAEHKGLCCESCLSDAEYEGFPNFDDHCCCMGTRDLNS